MDSTPGGLARRTPLWPFLGVCAAVAVWLDLGRIHRLGHADALVPILTSLFRWTPYYWQQNRFGMLVPLLAAPFHHPLDNLLVQHGLNLGCLLASVFLLARYALDHPAWPAAAAVGLASFIAFAPPATTYDAVIQPTTVGWVAGVLALLLLEPLSLGGRWRWRLPLALGLFALAEWVNLAAIATLSPLLVLRVALRPVRWSARCKEALTGLGLQGLALYSSMEWAKRSRWSDTAMGFNPAAEWPSAWTTLGHNLWVFAQPPTWVVPLAVMAGLGGLAWVLPGSRSACRAAARALGVLLGTAAVYWLFLGTQMHLKGMSYAARYLVPAILLAEVALAGWAFVPFARRWSLPWLVASCAALLLAASTWTFGFPSVAGVRADLDRTHGALTQDLLASGATHLAGSYWTVWPAVFHSSWKLDEAGQSRRVFGLTHRSWVTEPLWRPAAGAPLRVAVPKGDAEGATWLQTYGLIGLKPAGGVGALWLFTP